MTDQDIIVALGIEAADDELKQACVNNFRVTTHARLMNVLGELLTDGDMDHLEDMERAGATTEQMINWLSQNVANAEDIYQALAEDYIAELKERLQ